MNDSARKEQRAMSAALAELVDILQIEEIDHNYFRGRNPNEDDQQRIYGGQVAAQSLMAAGRTVQQGLPHSMHCYFLRPGDPSIPILFQVERTRDGRSFSSRHVFAIQHGRPIFSMDASFHIDEDGLRYNSAMPVVPDPEELPTFEERVAPFIEQLGSWAEGERSIDLRLCDPRDSKPEEWVSPQSRAWIRSNGSLPDDDLLHACIFAYASDMTMLDTTLRPHGLTWCPEDYLIVASLDHAIWFHQRFRADEWLLYDQETTVTAHARGFARASIFTRHGNIVASVTQEGLIRPTDTLRQARKQNE